MGDIGDARPVKTVSASAATHPASAKEVAALLLDATPEELDALSERYAEDPRKQVRHALSVALRRREREALERERVQAMYAAQLEYGGSGLVLGVDEVGRGAIAGPLTVCALALPAEPVVWGINDSKQLTPPRREALSSAILDVALAVGIAHVEPGVIDSVGMGSALRMAMAKAIEDAGADPASVLIDGNPVHVHPREKAIVKGDARIASIAAASIVAKVTRDRLMVDYDATYPGYHFAQCKGYASPAHIGAIRKLGLTPIHRVTFCGNFLEQPTLF